MTAQAGDTFLIPSAAAQKSALRSRLRAVRKRVPQSLRRQRAREAARHLLRRRVIARGARVAIYLSSASELDTEPLIAALLARGCSLYAPFVDHRRRMWFVPFRSRARLRPDALRLPSPTMRRPRLGGRGRRGFDLVLLPLLGFDDRGRRLGMGGGFYDRVLARPRIGRRPLLCGYAFDEQRVDAVPHEPWDVRLDAVATPGGVRHFRAR